MNSSTVILDSSDWVSSASWIRGESGWDGGLGGGLEGGLDGAPLGLFDLTGLLFEVTGVEGSEDGDGEEDLWVKSRK